jgi:ribonuclease R
MIVREITEEIWNTIKPESDKHTKYSYIKKLPIKSDFIEKYFFKAEFTTWSTNERRPYCRLLENLGPIIDENNYAKVIPLIQGISPEKYPMQAFEQAQKLAEEFEAKLEEEKKVRTVLTEEDLVFTIDGPGAQALDDALSFKQIEPNKYRLGIHIADVASLI